MLRRITSLVLAFALGGCSALDYKTAPTLRGIDYSRDEIARLLFAFDLPRGLAPVPYGSMLTFDAKAEQGERHVSALLEPADADDVAETLTPPGQGRAYYFFTFNEADRAAIDKAQDWARSLVGSGSSTTMSITLLPALCSNGPVDLATTNVSVLVASPGSTRMAPLIDHRKLSDLMAQSGETQLPACV